MRRIVLIAGLLLAACRPSHAQDPNALLRKMIATYRGLNSYTQRVSSTTNVRMGQKVEVRGLDGEVRYQKPNKLYVVVKSPTIGTVASTSDGREQIIYMGNINKYQKRPAPPTTLAFVDSLAEFGIGTFMDPLYFLRGDNAEQAFVGAKYKGTARVFGVTCQVVTAQLKPGSLQRVRSGTATYYIDPATGLARKIQMHFQGQPVRGVIRGTRNGKPVSTPVTLSPDVTYTENIQEAQANPPLNEASFRYSLPKGAQLQEVNRPLPGRR